MKLKNYIIIFAFFAAFFASDFVVAGNGFLSDIRGSMTDSRPSAISNYAISYSTGLGHSNNQRIKITFAGTNNWFSLIDADYISVTVNGVEKDVGVLCLGSESYALLAKTSSSITLVACNGVSAPANTPIQIDIGDHVSGATTGGGGITNPSTPGSYLMTIRDGYNEAKGLVVITYPITQSNWGAAGWTPATTDSGTSSNTGSTTQEVIRVIYLPSETQTAGAGGAGGVVAVPVATPAVTEIAKEEIKKVEEDKQVEKGACGTIFTDFNCDAGVDLLDFSVMMFSFGFDKSSSAFNKQADVNDDNVVDLSDLSILLYYWTDV